MRALTANEIAILKSRFQASASGHSQQVKLTIPSIGLDFSEVISATPLPKKSRDGVVDAINGIISPIVAYHARRPASAGGDAIKHVFVSRFLDSIDHLEIGTVLDDGLDAIRVGPWIAVGNRGGANETMVALWGNTTTYYIRTSTDNGDTWSAQATPAPLVGVTPWAKGVAQLYETPAKKLDGTNFDGNLWLFWIPTNGAHVFAATSADGGATWAATVDTGLSTASWFVGSPVDNSTGVMRMFYFKEDEAGNWWCITAFNGGSQGRAGIQLAKSVGNVTSFPAFASWKTVDYNTEGSDHYLIGSLIEGPAGRINVMYENTYSNLVARKYTTDGITMTPGNDQQGNFLQEDTAVTNMYCQAFDVVNAYGLYWAVGFSVSADGTFTGLKLYNEPQAKFYLKPGGALTGPASVIDVSDRVISISIDHDADLDSDSVNVELHNEDRSFDINQQVTAYFDAVIADAPDGYWRLGELAGTTAKDATASNMSGTYTGGFTLGQTDTGIADSDKCVLFNGSTGFVDLGHPSGLNGIVGAWTLECWAYANSDPGGAGLISANYDGSQVQFTLGMEGSKLYGGFYTVANGWKRAIDSIAFPLNTWVHCAITWDGTILRLYRNGAQTATLTPGNGPIASGGSFRIGRRHDTGVAINYWPGNVDEAMIKGTALTAGQIQAHYDARLGPSITDRSSYAQPNVIVDVYQWHGVVANKVRTFHGIIDSWRQHDSPRKVTLTARDGNKHLLVQEVVVDKPQDLSFDGTTGHTPLYVRTAVNYVYLNKTANAIITSVLTTHAGILAANISLAPNSFFFKEFRGIDGETIMTLIKRVCTSAGLYFWCDEDGIYRTAPYGQQQASQWTFRAYEDITYLDPDIDDDLLKTRVRVIGKKFLNAKSLKEVFRWPGPESPGVTNGPAGIAYDKSNSSVWLITQNRNLYNLSPQDPNTLPPADQRMPILSGPFDLSVIAYPDGLAIDPVDGNLWVSDGFNATTGNNANRKFRKINKVTLATMLGPFTNPDGDHCDLWAYKDGGIVKLKMTTYTTNKVYTVKGSDGSLLDAGFTITDGVVLPKLTGVTTDFTPQPADPLASGLFVTAFDSPSNSFYQVDLTGAIISKITQPNTNPTELTTIDDPIDPRAGSVFEVFRDANMIYLYEATDDTSGDTTTLATAIAYDLEGQLGERRLARITDLSITDRAMAEHVAKRELDRLRVNSKHVMMGGPGNPGVQKYDVVTLLSPSTGLSSDWVVTKIRSDQHADDGSYLMVLVMVPYVAGSGA